MKSLESRVAAIEARNQRVEADKRWETSWTRKISIALLTYALVTGFLFYIDNDAPFINALVPTGGFLLSTLLLKGIRSFWER
jgi:hypothetical protein